MIAGGVAGGLGSGGSMGKPQGEKVSWVANVVHSIGAPYLVFVACYCVYM